MTSSLSTLVAIRGRLLTRRSLLLRPDFQRISSCLQTRAYRPSRKRYVRFEDATPERLSAYQRENRGQEDEKYDYSRDYWGRERKPPFFSPHNRFYTTISVVAVLGGYYFYINHIETVPLTGRTRFIVRSERMDRLLEKTTYEQIIGQLGPRILPHDHHLTIYVKRVADALLSSVHRIPEFSGFVIPPGYAVHVVESAIPNAMVLPGGQIFVFSGILHPAASEDGLATVLAHEIAHSLLSHPAERMSMATLLSYGTLFLQLVTGGDFTTRILSDLIMQVGLMLPHSRQTEREADYVGLLLMATACYNPEESIAFWRRMQDYTESLARASKGKVPPMEFLSTHPSSDSRMEQLKLRLPEALQRRENSACNELPLSHFFNRVFKDY